MVKLNKIYTRTGDDGSTGLVDGSRVEKDSSRVWAYGDVDELNAAIGVARLSLIHPGIEQKLARIQNDLFDLGADLATPLKAEDKAGATDLRIVAPQVSRLEADIDALNADLAPLDSFVLPGGSAPSAHLHLARTIARRAERRVVSLAGEAETNPLTIHYLNRLSDLLFVCARWCNHQGALDVKWVPGGER